jgi:hypothetical protein
MTDHVVELRLRAPSKSARIANAEAPDNWQMANTPKG